MSKPFIVIDIELAPQPVPLPAIIPRLYVGHQPSTPEIQESAKHATNVRNIGDTTATRGERGDESHDAKSENEPPGFDGKDYENDNSPGEEDAVSGQYPVNGA